jgi:predicted lipoprotein with Yx(FWY)xxD motif
MRPTKRFISLAGVATAVMLIAAACSAAATTPQSSVLGTMAAPAATQAATSITIGMTNDAALGAYLTGQNGMTLYVFKNDTADTSSCTGTCATKWPSVGVAGGAMISGPTGATGTFTIITRPDGTMQVAYDHQPLYYYSGDSVAGDTNGQGLLGKWFVAPLTSGGSVATPVATAAATPIATAAPTVSTGY